MSLDHLSMSESSTAAAQPGLSLVAGAGMGTVAAELQPVFSAVDRIVHAWSPLFTPTLTGQVVFTIQPGRGRSLGWFCPDRWQRKASGECLPEINLCADQLARGVFDVAGTVVHELTHYANWRTGIRDCSSSQYHKRSFKDLGESVGLLCGPWDKSKGWGYTALSADARARIEQLMIDPEVFTLFRPQLGRRSGVGSVPKMRRWHCGGQTALCRPVWRATGTDLQAVCLACSGQFAPAGV